MAQCFLSNGTTKATYCTSRQYYTSISDSNKTNTLKISFMTFYKHFKVTKLNKIHQNNKTKMRLNGKEADEMGRTPTEACKPYKRLEVKLLPCHCTP